MSDARVHFETCLQLLAEAAPFVTVTVAAVEGSAPTDAGSRMVVSAASPPTGTIGGGRVEAKAIDLAQAMLADAAAPSPRLVTWNLQRDVGMTCGGVVTLLFERIDVSAWQVAVFGAGHVAQALVRLLLTLPCRVTCVDPREAWLEKLPQAAHLRAIRTDDPAAEAQRLPAGAFVVCVTKGHLTDLPVLRAVLQREPLPPYVGVIGSKSKAAVLRRQLLEQGVSAEAVDHLRCPIGLPLGSHHPAEIAVSIAAQLLQERDRSR